MTNSRTVRVPKNIKYDDSSNEFVWPGFISKEASKYLRWAFHEHLTRLDIWDTSDLTSEEARIAKFAASIYKRGVRVQHNGQISNPGGVVSKPQMQFPKLGDLLEGVELSSATLIVLDKNFAGHWREHLNFNKNLRIHESSINEQCKTIEGLYNDSKTINFEGIKTLVVMGGGVTLDVYGFLAYLRNLDLVYVPTTTLSIMDVCIGGKTGVNASYGKNQIGRFYSPSSVFIVPEFLSTLPVEQFNSGIYEHIKHLLIDGRASEISDQLFRSPMSIDQITLSLGIKGRIVETDELETGRRMLLNLGHSIGHALESFYLDNPINGKSLLHGEAVFLGMLVEVYFNFKLDILSVAHFESIHKKLTHLETYKALGKYLSVLDEVGIQTVFQYLTQDKKNLGVKNASITTVLSAEDTSHNNKHYFNQVSVDTLKIWFEEYLCCFA